MNRIGCAALAALGVSMTTSADAQDGSFAPTRKAGRFVYASSVRGSQAKGDVKAQTKRALESLDARLKAAGSSLASAASLNVFPTTLVRERSHTRVLSTVDPFHSAMRCSESPCSDRPRTTEG